MNVVVREVDVATVRPLRHAVLRPGRPLDESQYRTDDVAVHLAAYADEQLVGVATIFPDAAPDDRDAWRLRGMAVDPARQRGGIGAALLRRVFDVLEQRGVETLWCNARVPAVGFYERHGFTTMGEPFDIPNIGPHIAMRRALGQPRNS